MLYSLLHTQINVIYISITIEGSYWQGELCITKNFKATTSTGRFHLCCFSIDRSSLCLLNKPATKTGQRRPMICLATQHKNPVTLIEVKPNENHWFVTLLVMCHMNPCVLLFKFYRMQESIRTSSQFSFLFTLNQRPGEEHRVLFSDL